MSWFSSHSAVSVDQLIKEATDESIPNGELNLNKALELSDFIRSKKVLAKDVMRSLKKRLLLTKNPNLQLSILELVDFCIKNGGPNFISEISTREFLDSLNSKVIQDDDIPEVVTQKALKLVQIWAKAFESSHEFKNFGNLYQALTKQGYDFPNNIDFGVENNKIMFDSNVPPEWEDSDACMICSNSFSIINRKHHCRNCGGVFCGEHSSKFVELPELGILEPVRVCDTCHDEVKAKKKSQKKKKKKNVINARLEYNSEEEDEDLKRALELSLKESQANGQAVQLKAPQVKLPTADVEEVEDENLKAAIAASLRDLEQSKQKIQQAQEPQDAYSNLLPAQTSTYQLKYIRSQSQSDIPSPLLQSHPNKLSTVEETAIRQFATEAIESQNNSYFDPRKLTDFYRNAIPLQPKLNYELNESISRYDQLLDLNFKLDTVMRLYNQILDVRIERESYGYQEQQLHQNPLSQQKAQQYAQPQQLQYESQPQATPLPLPLLEEQRQNSNPKVPQYQTQQRISEYQAPYTQQQQYSGGTLPENSIGQDSFHTPRIKTKNKQFSSQPEEYLAPLGLSEPQYKQSSEPEPTQQPSELQYSQSQHQSPRQQFIRPQQQYAPPQKNSHKITDFNFPNVPAAKFPSKQEVQQQVITESKEEALIEL